MVEAPLSRQKGERRCRRWKSVRWRSTFIWNGVQVLCVEHSLPVREYRRAADSSARPTTIRKTQTHEKTEGFGTAAVASWRRQSPTAVRDESHRPVWESTFFTVSTVFQSDLIGAIGGIENEKTARSCACASFGTYKTHLDGILCGAFFLPHPSSSYIHAHTRVRSREHAHTRTQ